MGGEAQGQGIECRRDIASAVGQGGIERSGAKIAPKNFWINDHKAHCLTFWHIAPIKVFGSLAGDAAAKRGAAARGSRAGRAMIKRAVYSALDQTGWV